MVHPVGPMLVSQIGHISTEVMEAPGEEVETVEQEAETVQMEAQVEHTLTVGEKSRQKVMPELVHIKAPLVLMESSIAQVVQEEQSAMWWLEQKVRTA